jgi:hypothetical protein
MLSPKVLQLLNLSLSVSPCSAFPYFILLFILKGVRESVSKYRSLESLDEQNRGLGCIVVFGSEAKNQIKAKILFSNYPGTLISHQNETAKI